MNVTNLLNLTNTISKQRNILATLAATLLISNVLLTVYINFQDKIVVIVPSYTSKKFEISKSYISPDYLEMRARDVANLMLNVGSSNIDYVQDSLLRSESTDPSFVGELKKEFVKITEDVKKREVSTQFIMNEALVDNDGLSVEITGYLERKVGSRITDTTLKTYLIGFQAKGAKLQLNRFYEIAEEEKNEEN